MNAPISIVIPTRNDNYGGNQLEVAVATLNTMSRTFEEIVVVDYGSEEPFAPVLKEALGEERGNIKVITVPREWVRARVGDDQTMSDTVARNIGVRRAQCDVIASSNIDIIPAQYQAIDWAQMSESKFYTSPKYMIEQGQVREWRADGKSWEWIQSVLFEGRGGYMRQGDWQSDPWSKVSGCGDFQCGHKDVWYHPEVRGFEEALTLRNYADSNLHKKIIDNAGVDVDVAYWLSIFHQSHAQPTTAAWNDPHSSLSGFTHTTNDENWGAADIVFEETYL